MNIVLIGMRGSGKSTVGKLLANKLNKQFIDIDKLLVEREGKLLPAMITLHGWTYFRDKESQLVEEVSNQTNTIIATGGGVVLRKQNIDLLKKNGKFIFLKASIETMLKRIKNANDRPALTNKKTLKEEMEEVWGKRKSFYEDSANIIIETDKKTLKSVVDEIVSVLKLNDKS